MLDARSLSLSDPLAYAQRCYHHAECENAYNSDNYPCASSKKNGANCRGNRNGRAKPNEQQNNGKWHGQNGDGTSDGSRLHVVTTQRSLKFLRSRSFEPRDLRTEPCKFVVQFHVFGDHVRMDRQQFRANLCVAAFTGTTSFRAVLKFNCLLSSGARLWPACPRRLLSPLSSFGTACPRFRVHLAHNASRPFTSFSLVRFPHWLQYARVAQHLPHNIQLPVAVFPLIARPHSLQCAHFWSLMSAHWLSSLAESVLHPRKTVEASPQWAICFRFGRVPSNTTKGKPVLTRGRHRSAALPAQLGEYGKDMRYIRDQNLPPVSSKLSKPEWILGVYGAFREK